MKVQHPYPGLRPFERHESRIFFGREKQEDELLARLKDHHFLAVLGASGSGKSSLVKAGLLPALAKGYMGEVGADWNIAELRPGDQPFARLAEALLQGERFQRAWKPSTTNPGDDTGKNTQDIAFLAAALRRGARSLHEVLEPAPLPTGTRLLIVVDQFEEIFRYRTEAEDQASAFVALLLESCKHEDIYIVITMRSDFLGKSAEFPDLPEAFNDGLYLTPRLTREQLADAIGKPARLFGGGVQDELTNHLCNEAGNNPDQLPLLQHALMRLWEQDEDKTLTLDEYRRLNGLQGALDGHAEQAWDELDADGQRIAESLFRALTERSREGQDIRRPVKVREILDLIQARLEALIRVVDVFRRPGRNFLMASPSGELAPDTTLDISHESLIRQWQRLQGWVVAEGEKADMLKRLSEAAERYRNKQGELWYGTDLALALNWRDEQQPTEAWAGRYLNLSLNSNLLPAGRGDQQPGVPVTTSEHEPGRAVLGDGNQENSLSHSGEGGGKGGKFQLTLAFLAESEAEQQREQQVEDDRRQREVKQAWQRTVKLFDSTLTHASLLTKIEDFATARKKLQSTAVLDTEIPAQRRRARDLLAGFVNIMGGEAEATYEGAGVPLAGDVAISPDGRWLVASGERGTLALFESESGKLVQKLEGHDRTAGTGGFGNVNGIVFHPQQPWLFSGGEDGQIIRWQLPQDGQEARSLQQWPVDAGEVTALAMTPDGKTLASGHTDGKVRLWQADNGKTMRVLEGHSQAIAGLVFSPNGGQLASASFDNTVRLWDWEKAESLQVLEGHDGDVNGVAFSPDGQWLASSSDDESILLWNAQTDELTKRLKGHRNVVFGLQFFPNGLLASASSDNTIRLWDVETGVTRRILQGHTAAVGGLALWRADLTLYSASNDGTVKRWGVALPQQWLVDLPDSAISSAISPHGKFVVVGLENGNLQVYSLPDLRLLQEVPKAHQALVGRLSFNEDATLMASGSRGDTDAKVWYVSATGELKLKQTFSGHTGAVHAVTFSPDGSQLATASYDGRIGLFALEGGGNTVFEAHPAGNNGGVMSVSFTSDGKQLLSAGYYDFEIKLWSLATHPPSLQKPFPKAQDALLWASSSPDGQWLAGVGREQAATLYPTRGEGPPLRLQGHKQTVFKAIFSPDSRQLATVSADMTVRLWDLDTQGELLRLRLPTEIDVNLGSPVWDFDFRCTPTGCWIAVPLTSGKLALYNLGKIDYE